MPAPRFAATVAALATLATVAQTHDNAAAAADAAAADLQRTLTAAIDTAQAEGLNVSPSPKAPASPPPAGNGA